MFSAFKTRRPWAVGLVCLLFSPLVTMLYLSRGRNALIYLGVELTCVVALFASMDPVSMFAYGLTRLWIVELPLKFVGIVHGVLIARKRPMDEPLRWYAHWYAIVAIFLLVLAVLLGTRTFLYQTFNTPSESMSPTLNRGDYFLVAKFAYDIATPERGDLVVFREPTGNYIKRIVGLPGDRIQMVAGQLHINGTGAPLRRIEDFDMSFEDGSSSVKQFVESLPGGRSHDVVDLIDDGPGDDTPVFAVPAGSYFVIGDNRDNSTDSRNTLGFVPASAIVGKVAYKYVDGRTQKFSWAPIE
jgi:signal peptidase I